MSWICVNYIMRARRIACKMAWEHHTVHCPDKKMNWQVEMDRPIFSRFAALCALLLGALVLGARPVQAEAPLDAPPPKVIYLTFDDGPSPYTQAVLDVLRLEAPVTMNAFFPQD